MIDIKNLTAGYNKVEILKELSLSLDKGMLTSIIGPNGSGKSTLLKSLLGILPKQNGEILIDGTGISSMKRGDVAKKLAYLSQEKSSPDMTVEELVLHGRFPYLKYPRGYSENDKKVARLAISRIGIGELSQKPISKLSGGMKQSAYIAMALAQETDYILLDEPTAHLDVSHQLELMKILRTLADDGKGIVTVMHDLPLALSFSDSVAVLQNGKILFFGTPGELIKSDVIKNVFGVSVSHENSEYYYQISKTYLEEK